MSKKRKGRAQIYTEVDKMLRLALILLLALSAIEATPSKLARFEENATKLKELLRKGHKYIRSIKVTQ